MPAFDVLVPVRFEDLQVGATFTVETLLEAEKIDAFAAVSGDYSPVHQDDEAARRHGFPGRLAYGFQVLSLFSALVGQNFHMAICASVSADFVAPAFVGDRLTLRAEVVQIQPGMRDVVLSVRVFRGDAAILRGKLFTRFL